MTEAPLTRRFLAEVQKQLPLAVIFKINDRTTAGILDAIVNFNHSLWLEFKKHPNKLTPLQKLNIDRLNQVNVPAWSVTYENGYWHIVTARRPFINLSFEEAVRMVCRELIG